MALPTFYLFAGEMSGDMYGAQLMRALQKEYPHPLKFSGVAGPQMRKLGLVDKIKMEDFSVMGFSDVIRVLPRLWKQFHQIKRQILDETPDAVIFIDSPSFSLRMAHALKKAGYQGKIIQYISPTVWAWGPDRIKKMAQDFDLLLTIYPFEKQFFNTTNLPVEYVGHPLQEIIKSHTYKSDWMQNQPELIGIFPGSRPSEIGRNLPKQLQAARLMREKFPHTTFAISCSDEKNKSIIEMLIERSGFTIEKDLFLIPKHESYNLMQRCRSAMAKSGTVTLELALHGCPTVVSYQLTKLNYFIAKYFLKVKLPYYCIVNILLKQEVFPELIAKPFTAEQLFQKLESLHLSGEKRNHCIEKCLELKEIFGQDNASENAAKAIKSQVF